MCIILVMSKKLCTFAEILDTYDDNIIYLIT